MTMVVKKTPMFILLMIVMVSMTMAHAIMTLLSGHWSAIMLVLVYVSGVMVLFMYVTSLSPYEKSKSKTKLWVITVLMMSMMTLEVKQESKSMWNTFENSFISELSVTSTVALMLSVMATIVPKMMMNMNKGMKSSK